MSRHLSPTADNALASQLELAFEDNRLAAQLYGDFDQNLALIEQRLKVSATPRGNHVLLKGAASSVDQARRVLESLYGSLEEGRSIVISDVDGVIRMIQTEDSQLTLPTLERKGKVRMAQIRARPERYPQAHCLARRDWSALDWRVKTPADMAFANGVYGALHPDDPAFGLEDVLGVLQGRQDLARWAA